MEKFTLKKEIRKPIDDIALHTLMFVGEKKIGKTAFAVQFEDSHVLEMEVGNANHLECSYTDIHNWEQACGALVYLQENPDFCKTIIVDDVPTLYEYCLDWVRSREGKEGTDANNFDIWRGVKYYFGDWVRNFQALKMGRIFTAHTAVNEVELRKSNRKISQLEPSWSKQCREILEKYTKMTGYLMWNNENQRVIQIKGDDFVKANNGFHDHFIYNGEQVSEISMGASAKEAYDNFIYAYKNFPGSEPVNAPTQSQSVNLSDL